MHPLTAAEMLYTWEVGLAQPPLNRALTLLTAAWPETTPGTLVDLSIGQRNARLLRLREETFGPALSCYATCPHCGEPAELAFQISDVTVDASDDITSPVTIRHDGYEIEVRVPTIRDVLAVAGGDAATIRQNLLDRCVLRAREGDREIAASDLPEPVVGEIAHHLAGLDAQAEIRLGLTCPACGQPWDEGFDIFAYFWIEIDAWANRLLHDVHSLAVAHGWREADILALSPARRRRYLDMVGA